MAVEAVQARSGRGQRASPARALRQTAQDGGDVQYAVDTTDAAAVTATLSSTDASTKLAAQLSANGMPISASDVEVTQTAAVAQTSRGVRAGAALAATAALLLAAAVC